MTQSYQLPGHWLFSKDLKCRQYGTPQSGSLCPHYFLIGFFSSLDFIVVKNMWHRP